MWGRRGRGRLRDEWDGCTLNWRDSQLMAPTKNKAKVSAVRLQARGGVRWEESFEDGEVYWCCCWSYCCFLAALMLEKKGTVECDSSQDLQVHWLMPSCLSVIGEQHSESIIQPWVWLEWLNIPGGQQTNNRQSRGEFRVKRIESVVSLTSREKNVLEEGRIR